MGIEERVAIVQACNETYGQTPVIERVNKAPAKLVESEWISHCVHNASWGQPSRCGLPKLLNPYRVRLRSPPRIKAITSN